MRESRTTRVQAYLCLIQGFGYTIYSLWRIAISPLEYFNAPEPFGLAAIAFFVLLLIVGGYFLTKSFLLFKGGSGASPINLTVPFLSIPLWLLPVYFIFGVPLPSFSIGVGLSVVGAADILSIIIAYLKWRAQRFRKTSPEKAKEKAVAVPEKRFKWGARSVFSRSHLVSSIFETL